MSRSPDSQLKCRHVERNLNSDQVKVSWAHLCVLNYTKKSETFCRHLPNPRRKGSFHYLTLLKPNLINKSTKTIANMAITDQTDPENAQRRWMPYPFFFIIHTHFLQCYNFPGCFFSCHVHLPVCSFSNLLDFLEEIYAS
jgi:hypothetical protein